MDEGRPPAPLPARVTTPLLQLITQQSLDEDYEHVAQQRATGARPPSRGRGRGRLTVVALAVFGVLVAVAAAQTARNADVTTAGREQLISRIADRRETVAGLQQRIARLQASNAAAEDSANLLDDRLQTALARRELLLAPTGFGPMRGKGVRLVIDDAPSGDASGEVRDDDLGLVVNGLWEAGAQGVSVNGQRVTALSALRNAGQVININTVPLSPPYAVEAIGDPRTLQADFAETASGARFLDVADQVGITVDMKVATLLLPPAPERMMRVSQARAGSSKQAKPPVNKEDTP